MLLMKSGCMMEIVFFYNFSAGVDKVPLPTHKCAGNNWTRQVKFRQQLDPPQKMELFVQGIGDNFGFFVPSSQIKIL